MPTPDQTIKNGFPGRWFLNSASVLLLTFALALAWCNGVNSGLTLPHDPLLGMALRANFWFVGGLFLAVSLICLGVGSYFTRVTLVAWLAFNFQVYQLALLLTHSRAMHGYFGYFSLVFHLPPQVLEMFTQGAFLYLLAGGLLLIIRLKRGERQARALAGQVASGEMVKCHCQACGGHLLFPAANLGHKLPCPHCQTVVMLRKPDENLKISCFFCKEHIEFPAHALGQKVFCPHCNKEVRLKEEIALHTGSHS